MNKKMTCLVTGANGHLGNNLVRALIKDNYQVRASVRDLNNKKPFEGLNCELVYADLLNKESLKKAMKDVAIVFHVASVFKHWSNNPQKDIIEPNVIGTKNIMEAAAACNVDKVIVVSSIATLDHTLVPMTENTWNRSFPNAYYQSKQEAEQMAWAMARELQVNLITVLPSSIIGGQVWSNLTPTMAFFDGILNNVFPINPNFSFNYVDVTDVAAGIILADKYGKIGERYILATEPSITTYDVFSIAQELFPEVLIPPKLSKPELLELAKQMERESMITKLAPPLMVNTVMAYYGVDSRVNISKARTELGYNPISPVEAIKNTLLYLKQKMDK
ncbi:NAD-dependent epimerase/dehydratase family protein [Chryseobacterium turcicum]|uniref:NAD-dependent epimerase/dehydratase family protein n=1 Tax=Chryseobacterium turcicum TaxID=2898076 RepID=A0A9Q3V206_9FLAO|nr:NAD-dependent epimerase/dehydratase family protein [Chryseobacterium turcicum]MCD1117369.1 NAD-dependent epimerase/dehydratase family protein [Chryseobacterium turcicum]